MPNRRGKSQGSAGRRGDVLQVLKRAASLMSIADIAEQLGVHPNTVRFHLETLVTNGQVERVEARDPVPGRPRGLFKAVAGMDPTGARHYRLLAEVLVESLAARPDSVDQATEAGRAWGRLHNTSPGEAQGAAKPVDRLVALLDELGFVPERSTSDNRRAPKINIRNCPFFELATHLPQVACPIHLGLMQGAMEAWRSPVTVDRLEAFVEPDRCVAHLAETRGA